MADVAVENLETRVVEKEVEDVDVPKVVDDEVVENGKEAAAPADEEVAVENGTSEADAEAVVTSTPAEEVDAAEVAEEAKNGDAEAPEAVKRKAEVDSVDAPADEAVCPTPEKKSKLDEPATENGAAEEVAA